MIRSLKVGGIFYDVEVTENIELGINYTGQIHYRGRKIQIRPNKSPQSMLQTMLHETFHAVDEFLGIKRSEEEIDRDAQVLAMLVVDNPELFSVETYKGFSPDNCSEKKNCPIIPRSENRSDE